MPLSRFRPSPRVNLHNRSLPVSTKKLTLHFWPLSHFISKYFVRQSFWPSNVSNKSLLHSLHACSANTLVSVAMFARRRLLRHTGARVCRQLRRLLCQSVYWLVHRRRRQTSCNASSTQLHESYRTEVWPSSSARLYTGSTSPTGSGSGSASKCTCVSTAWLTDIWPSSATYRQHRWSPALRSAGRGQLDVPRVRLPTYGCRTSCYAGPSSWERSSWL